MACTHTPLMASSLLAAGVAVVDLTALPPPVGEGGGEERSSCVSPTPVPSSFVLAAVGAVSVDPVENGGFDSIETGKQC